MDFSPSLHLLIADDHEIARFALIHWLQEEEQREGSIIAQITAVATGRQALDTIRVLANGNNPIGMVVIDLDMPDMTGLEAIATLRSEGFEKPILVISGSHLGTARDALSVGASGYISKQEGQSVFLEGIRFLAHSPRATWLSPETHRQMMYSDSVLKKANLTATEQHILRLIKLSNKEIADKMGIAESTVKKHLWSIFQKLGITSRYDAITFAIEAGLIVTR
jgi:DNA-binding NarL/FixJ family response regulator